MVSFYTNLAKKISNVNCSKLKTNTAANFLALKKDNSTLCSDIKMSNNKGK